MNHPEFSAKSKIQGILMQEIFSLLQMPVFQLFVLSLPFFLNKKTKPKKSRLYLFCLKMSFAKRSHLEPLLRRSLNALTSPR
jgi:hypothetical protein